VLGAKGKQREQAAGRGELSGMGKGRKEGDKAAQFRNVVNDCLLNLHVFVSVCSTRVAVY
jgi:hypothetical protein